MSDLFKREQQVYENAVKHLNEIQNAVPCSSDEFKTLAAEYGRLLKLVRRVTKISDRTTDFLNSSKLDLLDKVHYDSNTGIYNRRFMEENLKRVIRSTARSGGELSVLMMDIDYFKKYNDTYGHATGDKCLKTVAQAIKSSIMRADDFAARYGGEEFAAILPNTDGNGARMTAERIFENIRECRIPHEKNEVSEYVTISIGITTGTAKRTQTNVDYIKRADEALYISKQSGRNQYTFLKFEEDEK